MTTTETLSYHLTRRRPKNQEAITTLPTSGTDGSLTVNNDIVIDTTAPYVIAVISLREGVYTMGQTVDLQVGATVASFTLPFRGRNNGTGLAFCCRSPESMSTTAQQQPVLDV